MGFRKAERRQVKLKLGLAGASGSGKTFSALRIAKGLLEAQGNPNGRIALIDTENKSASLYADTKNMPAFDALELEPPYTVDKYIDAIELAIKEKYDVLIIDSISHVWSGEGGLLQEKETLDARGGNSYTNWAKMTPKWNRLVSGVLHGDIHMLCTMRSKQDYVLETNDKGKQAPKKVGMAPQVREGFEYELTAVFDMDMTHHAQASKDRTNLFDGAVWKPDEKTGAVIWNWLATGKTPEPPKVITPPPAAASAPYNGPIKPRQQESTPGTAPDISGHLKARAAAIDLVLNTTFWPRGTCLTYCEMAFGKKFGDLDDVEFATLVATVKHKTFVQAKVDLASKQKAAPPVAAATTPPESGSFDAFSGGLAGGTASPVDSREPGQEG